MRSGYGLMAGRNIKKYILALQKISCSEIQIFYYWLVLSQYTKYTDYASNLSVVIHPNILYTNYKMFVLFQFSTKIQQKQW